MGKALLTPRHSLNAFFRSPSQLNVRTGGSQQKLTAHFVFSSIHKLKFVWYKANDLTHTTLGVKELSVMLDYHAIPQDVMKTLSPLLLKREDDSCYD